MRWSPAGLVGRVARALGFRWVFPVGTMAVPWHPAFLPLVLAALGVWSVSRVVGLAVGNDGGAGGAVVGLAVGFVVVGLLLSVPVLAWVVLALGGRLVQALLALVAMVLLSVSIATGDDPLWLVVLPTAYVVTWTVQAVGGRIALLRLRKHAATFGSVDVRGRAVVMPSDTEGGAALDLLLRGGAGSVWQRSWQSGDGGIGRVVVTADQARELREVARNALPDGTALDDVQDRATLSWLGALPRDAVVFDVDHRPDPGGLVGDRLWRVELDGRSLVTGEAQVVLPVPLLNAFYWVSLTSRNEWVVGFGRGRARRIGPDRRSLHELVGAGEPVDSTTHPDVLAALDSVWRQVADRDAAIERLRAEAVTGPVDLSAHQAAHEELRRHGAQLLGPGAAETLATWLEHARDGRHPREPLAVARLIESLADEEIVRHGERLVDAFNSRKLALRWRLAPDLDVAPLPRDLYRFGNTAGFGLALDEPQVYVRLGDLVQSFRPLVAELHGEMDLGDEVREALRRWHG